MHNSVLTYCRFKIVLLLAALSAPDQIHMNDTCTKPIYFYEIVTCVFHHFGYDWTHVLQMIEQICYGSITNCKKKKKLYISTHSPDEARWMLNHINLTSNKFVFQMCFLQKVRRPLVLSHFSTKCIFGFWIWFLSHSKHLIFQVFLGPTDPTEIFIENRAFLFFFMLWLCNAFVKNVWKNWWDKTKILCCEQTDGKKDGWMNEQSQIHVALPLAQVSEKID